MATRKKSVADYLENKIQFYRYCTIVAFILGLLAGAGILCGDSCLFSIGFPGRYLALTKCALCFLISLSGIVAASAYRSRIRYAVERCNKILLYSDNGEAFPKPVREQSILEVQVLFGIMFVLAMVACCVNYPLPGLPDYLDLPLIRLLPLVGFFLFCWISTKLEKKNSLIGLNSIEDFIRLHQKQARISNQRAAATTAEWSSGKVIRKTRAVTMSGPQQMQQSVSGNNLQETRTFDI